MARKTLTVQPIVRAGMTAGYTAFTTGGIAWSNDGRNFMHVVKQTGDTVITIQTPNTVDGLAIAERTVALGADTELFIGPFQPGVYNRSDDTVYADTATAESITVAILGI